MDRTANRARLGQILDRLHAEVQTRAINGSQPDAGILNAGILNAGIARTTVPDFSAREQGRVLRGRPRVTQLAFAGIAGLPAAGVVILSLIILTRDLASNPYLIAGILALGSGVLLFLIGLILGLILRPVIITPTRYQADQVKAHPVAAGQFPPDPAWPLYPFRQAGIDRRVVRMYLSILTWRVGLICSRALYRAWQRPGDALSRGRHASRIVWWLFFPVAVAVMVFLLAGGLSAWCCYAVYWPVHEELRVLDAAAHAGVAGCPAA